MASAKDIQRRIKSVNSTQKVTRAMGMVAASKMRKAVEAVIKTRTYANLSWETILNLSHTNGTNGKSLHPLLEKRGKISKVGIVLITSNRGLCGGFNTSIIKKVHDSIIKHSAIDDRKTEFILIGNKGVGVNKHYGHHITAEFAKADIVHEIKEVWPISRLVIDGFLQGKYDKIMVAYTDFVNPSKQIPRVRQLLPVDITAEDDYLGIVGKDTRVGLDKDFVKAKQEKHLAHEQFSFEYTFEPSPREVLDELIPRLIEIQLYQALLESNASEHSARMRAMHQATDAARDMVQELTLFYNKARQASITAEIAEISAGANALAE